MHADFWHERWQRNQIGFHQDGVNPYLPTYWPALDAGQGARVFVPLCGKTVDMRWLRSQGHTVLGVEISPLAVQAFFAEHDLPATVREVGRFRVYEADGICIYCGDFFDLTPGDLAGVRAVFDRASLVAFPPDMRSRYAAHMQALLAPGSRVLLVAFDYPQHEMQGPPFSVQAHEVQVLYERGCEVSLLHTADILAQEPHFRAKGITRLEENIYRLTFNPHQEFSCAS